MKWALYEEEDFRGLIEDVIGLVDRLIETIPVTRQTQRELCGVEVSEIGSDEGLPTLHNIAASQDKDL